MDDVIEGALELLSKEGVMLKHAEMQELLYNKGADVNGDNVKMDRDMVYAAIATAPKEFSVYDSSGQKEIKLGVDKGVNFVSKPVSPDELLYKVREVLDH